MCPGDAPVAGGVRRWRPGACICGPDMSCSGADGRWAPQMILNNRITAACRAGASRRAEQKLVFRATARKIISDRPRGKASRERKTGESRAGASWRAEQKLVFRAAARKIISGRLREKPGGKNQAGKTRREKPGGKNQAGKEKRARQVGRRQARKGKPGKASLEKPSGERQGK